MLSINQLTLIVKGFEELVVVQVIILIILIPSRATRLCATLIRIVII